MGWVGKTVLIGIGVLGVAAVYFYRRQLSLLENLTYKLINFNVAQLLGTSATINITMQIYSPSTIEAEISNLYLDLYVNNQHIGFIQSLQPFLIPARGTSNVNVSITFSPDVVIADAVGLLTNYVATQNFPVSLNGYASIKTAGISISIPYVYNTTLQQLMAST